MEDPESEEVAELPCLYQIKKDDSWDEISEDFYDTRAYFDDLRDLNRQDDGRYRSLQANDILFIPNHQSDELPHRFPWCSDALGVPCLHRINRGDRYNPGDTYESIAQMYFRRSNSTPIETIVACINNNNWNSDNKPHELDGDNAPVYITVPDCN